MGKITVTDNCNGIAGLKVIEPEVRGDHRGYFMESYNYNDFAEGLSLNIGIDVIVHDLTDVDQSVKGSEPDECTELGDFDNLSLDKLIDDGLEDELFEPNGLVHVTLAVDDVSVSDRLDVTDEDRDCLV